MLGSVPSISRKSFLSDFCMGSEYSYENAFVKENQFLVNFQSKSFKIHNSQQMYFFIYLAVVVKLEIALEPMQINKYNEAFAKANTAQKIKFFTRDFSSKCDQIRRKLRIWSHLLEKSLMENFIFCAV